MSLEKGVNFVDNSCISSLVLLLFVAKIQFKAYLNQYFIAYILFCRYYKLEAQECTECDPPWTFDSVLYPIGGCVPESLRAENLAMLLILFTCFLALWVMSRPWWDMHYFWWDFFHNHCNPEHIVEFDLILSKSYPCFYIWYVSNLFYWFIILWVDSK